ncbi:uncharacterized protein LOC129599839 isoform X2 [Paramacrobiotus metropolitanus]|uniref:uncharacterized protein LOC129599839 isoform X2 n=1 Tax=Paramacrobiotus metropolitanus TaxID=2943436 RepID=UPI0024463AA1|nr:uncharacterized protein LOC129599839 isoform X2 [Paramacrobiotus metropolitanus]
MTLRSESDFSTFDPAFDDVMRKAVEKSSSAKPIKRLIRRLVLVYFARGLLICTVLVVKSMQSQSGDKRHENKGREHQEQPSQRPFFLEYLSTFIDACTTFAFAGFGNACFLCYVTRKLRGKWFLLAANMEDDMSVSVAWSESNGLLWAMGFNLLLAILATVSVVTVVGTVEFYSPGLFFKLWWLTGYVLWYNATVGIPPWLGPLLIIPPGACLDVIGLITTWQCRRAILRFQKICSADGPRIMTTMTTTTTIMTIGPSL